MVGVGAWRCGPPRGHVPAGHGLPLLPATPQDRPEQDEAEELPSGGEEEGLECRTHPQATRES